MALTLYLDVTTYNCNYIKLYDTTGLYNVSSNPTGWSDNEAGPTYPTMRRQDVTDARIDVMDLEGNHITGSPWDITSIVTAAATESEPLIFLQQQLTIPDGAYQIVFTVTGLLNGVQKSYYTIYKKYFYCTVACCVLNGWLGMEAALCDPCDTSYLTTMRMKQNLLDTIKAAECMQDDCAFNNALGRLERLCEGLDSYSVSPCNCN